MGKMMGAKTAIWWITDPTFNPDAPQAALLTNAANISCAIEAGYTLGPVKSQSDSSASICDNSHFENPTFYNYDGKLTFFREGNLADTVSDYYKAFNFFKSGTATLITGYLVKRIGYLSTVAPAAGQIVSSYKFIFDNPMDMDDGTAPIRFQTEFKQQGKMSQFVALV